MSVLQDIPKTFTIRMSRMGHNHVLPCFTTYLHIYYNIFTSHSDIAVKFLIITAKKNRIIFNNVGLVGKNGYLLVM